MNLADLRIEFYARGFAYLDDDAAGAARATRWINQAYHSLMEEADYPFDETTVTSVAPIQLDDLRDIVYVSSQNGVIDGRDITAFLNDDPTLTQSGVAAYWYLDNNTLKTWPTDSATSFTVRYTRVPPDLSNGTDVPIIPDRYHPLIVDFAVIRALRDRSNFDEATALRQSLEDDLRRMRETLFDRGPVWFQRQTDLSNA